MLICLLLAAALPLAFPVMALVALLLRLGFLLAMPFLVLAALIQPRSTGSPTSGGADGAGDPDAEAPSRAPVIEEAPAASPLAAFEIEDASRRPLAPRVLSHLEDFIAPLAVLAALPLLGVVGLTAQLLMALASLTVLPAAILAQGLRRTPVR